ncbi:MAG: hypothetical protein ACFUZC_21165 [Chthoniobacteraceae bacterium]
MDEIQDTAPKQKLKRLHQESCGFARMEYDSYEDVRLACERKLAQWVRQGVIPPWQPMANNDWIFSR